MEVDHRPYETLIEREDSGLYTLNYIDNRGDDWKPVLTPAGHQIKHRSKVLLQEIQSEFKSGTPKQLIERFSNYQLLCSQIDEFEHGTHFTEYSEDLVTQLLMEDGAFFPMHPPEEVERLYNLEFLSDFLEDHFGERHLSTFLVSSPPWTQSTWGRHDSQGERFEEFRNEIFRLIKESSLEQLVVMHSAAHMCRSVTIALLLAHRLVMPKEFALGAVACQAMIPDMFDEAEQAELLDHQDKLALYSNIMSIYLENSTPETERLIARGEGISVEFKATFRMNLHTNRPDKSIETASLKEIVAFLNTIGGHLIIGVEDNGSVCGLGKDGFSSVDHYTTHISNQLNLRVGADFGKYLAYNFETVRDLQVLDIGCQKLPSHETAFLDAELYVRNAAQTIKLSTRQAIEWQNKRS